MSGSILSFEKALDFILSDGIIFEQLQVPLLTIRKGILY